MVPVPKADVVCPKAGVDPKAGVVVAPNAGVLEVAPNAGVVEPKAGVPNAGADVAGVLPKRPVEG